MHTWKSFTKNLFSSPPSSSSPSSSSSPASSNPSLPQSTQSQPQPQRRTVVNHISPRNPSKVFALDLTEILHHVSHFLSRQDLYICIQVSSTWHSNFFPILYQRPQICCCPFSPWIPFFMDSSLEDLDPAFVEEGGGKIQQLDLCFCSSAPFKLNTQFKRSSPSGVFKTSLRDFLPWNLKRSTETREGYAQEFHQQHVRWNKTCKDDKTFKVDEATSSSAVGLWIWGDRMTTLNGVYETGFKIWTEVNQDQGGVFRGLRRLSVKDLPVHEGFAEAFLSVCGKVQELSLRNMDLTEIVYAHRPRTDNNMGRSRDKERGDVVPFSRLLGLCLMDIRGASLTKVFDVFMAASPNLVHLEWGTTAPKARGPEQEQDRDAASAVTQWGHISEGEPLMTRFKDHSPRWVDIDFRFQCGFSSVSDECLAAIIQAIEPSLEQGGEHSQHSQRGGVRQFKAPESGFGPLTILAMIHHRWTIRELDLRSCSLIRTSMIHHLLSNLARLESFAADIFLVSHLESTTPPTDWACLRIKSLTLFFSLKDQTDKDGDSNEERLQGHIFKQLGQLTRLEILDLRYPRIQQNGQLRPVNHQERMRHDSLPTLKWRVDSALPWDGVQSNELKHLTQLKTLYLPRQAMRDLRGSDKARMKKLWPGLTVRE